MPSLNIREISDWMNLVSGMLCLQDLTAIGWQFGVRFVNRDGLGIFLMAVSLQTVRGGSGPPKGISTEECSHRKLCPRMTSQQRLAITDNLIFLYSLPLRCRDTMQCPRVVEEWELLAIRILSELGVTASPSLLTLSGWIKFSELPVSTSIFTGSPLISPLMDERERLNEMLRVDESSKDLR